MATKESENLASTIVNKVVEGAKALPGQVKKLANSVMGNDTAKPAPKAAKKPSKAPAKSKAKARKAVSKTRKAARKK